jgi:hypothetical protein
MVSSSLEVYHSRTVLTNRLSDYSNVYLLPCICAFGLLTNLASILVTVGMRNKDHMIKYILINSSVDFLFLLTQLFVFIIRCGDLCPFGYTYAAKFYENYIYFFIGYSLILFQNLFNLYMTIERLCLLSKNIKYRRFLSKVNKKWLFLLFFVVAIFFNVPINFFLNEIRPLGILINIWNTSGADANSTETLFAVIQKSNTLSLQIIKTCLYLIKNPLLLILIGFVNIVVAVKFHNFIRKKQKTLKIQLKG